MVAGVVPPTATNETAAPLPAEYYVDPAAPAPYAFAPVGAPYVAPPAACLPPGAAAADPPYWAAQSMVAQS